MDTCKSMKLNSDLSENVTYNTPEFPAYIRMEQLSLYPDYRGVSHWHDDVEFIMMVDGQMAYDINGQSIDMQTAISSACECLYLSCPQMTIFPRTIWSLSPAIPDILTRSLLPPFYGRTRFLGIYRQFTILAMTY